MEGDALRAGRFAPAEALEAEMTQELSMISQRIELLG
jgi:hypothetical protein